MKRLILPAVALAVIASAYVAVMKLNRGRRAADVVAAPAPQIDKPYRAAKGENAALAERVAAAANRTELKDAVGDRPKAEKGPEVTRLLPLPGYNY